MHEVRSIAELLTQIRRGEILLPEFQRGYVWNSDQVRGLFQSLYHKHPTGHLLVWKTYKPSPVRGAATTTDGHSLLLLDGQQRLTSLYVLFEGKAPPFYEGESLFANLHFNLQTEEFRFWQKTVMEKNPAWIGVHDFLRQGLDSLLEKLDSLPDEEREMFQKNLSRLSRLNRIREYTYTVDQLSGDEYTVDQVVDIFNRVNKAGTPLTKADLALAHICSIWPEAREELRRFSRTVGQHGFGVDMNFLVRCIAGVAAGSVLLEGAFFRVEAEKLQSAWKAVRGAFEHLVNVLRHEAFTDSLNDVPTLYVLVPMTVYLARCDGVFPTDSIKRRFIRWMYLAGIWSRYSGATDTKLQQDVSLVGGRDLDPTHELEAAILRERGRLTIEASDLTGASIQTAYATFSYVLARAREARDWFSGIRLYDKAVGKSNGLESHHIFPKAVLTNAGYDTSDDRKVINELANRAYLTQKANRKIHSKPPSEYFPDIEAEVVPVRPGEFGVELLLREEAAAPHAEAAGDEGEHVASDGDERSVRLRVVDRSNVHTHVNIRDEEPPREFLEICPGLEIVEAADDDVDHLESLKRLGLGEAPADRSASRAHRDPPHHPVHDGRLSSPEPDVEAPEPEESVAIGRRDPIGINECDLAHAEMRKLMNDMTPASAQAHDPHPRVRESALAVVANDEKLPGEAPRVRHRGPRLRRPPVDDGGPEPPHVHFGPRNLALRYGDEPGRVRFREHDRPVRAGRDARPEHWNEAIGAPLVVSG